MSVKIRKDGITMSVHDNEIDRYLRAGYKKVEEPTEEVGSGQPESISIAQIYAFCEKANVKPEDLMLEDEHPTIAQVKAAIKSAKKAGE